MGRIKTPAISELLIAALDDPQVEIRVEAARVLGVRKDQRAVDRLLQAVAEGGPYQSFSIRMLGEIGDPRAFEPLQSLLTAPQFMLRREVVTALRKIDNARAVDLFYEQLEGGGLSLEDSLEKFAEGISLVRKGEKLLSEAEKRIEQLLSDDGGAKVVPLELKEGDQIEIRIAGEFLGCAVGGFKEDHHRELAAEVNHAAVEEIRPRGVKMGGELAHDALVVCPLVAHHHVNTAGERDSLA